MSMAQPAGGSVLQPEHNFVFRDFERSRNDQFRSELAARPIAITLIYIVVVVLWTLLMSMGAAVHGNDAFAVNLSPHVAHYTLIVGVMFYPLRRLWIPVLVFAGVFALPFFVPNHFGDRWIDLPAVTGALANKLFLLHLATGLAIGGLARGVQRLCQPRFTPYTVDMAVCLVVYFAFLLLCSAQAIVIGNWLAALPVSDQAQIGYDADFLNLSLERIARGGVVAAVFLLAVLVAPTLRQTLIGLAIATVFPLMVLVQNAGFVMHPALDVAAIALFMVLVLPAPIALSACIVGVPIYAGLTGEFLGAVTRADELSGWLDHYATVALTFVAFVIALRNHLHHTEHNRSASMRRLERVRDFADVGLLSFNLDNTSFRADASAQRILHTAAEGRLPQFLDLFDGNNLAELTDALLGSQHGQINLLLGRTQTADQPEQILRMCLWYETAPSGDEVAYGLVLDVTEEHQQERALQATLAELSSKQERQRQLFSIISHELRTPASVVSMLVDDLHDLDSLPRTQKQLRDATDQLLSTLADMRQTVNPTKNLPVKLLPYSAADLAESVRNMFIGQAQEHAMSIRLVLSHEAQKIRVGDQTRVRQALSNLLRNALIHSKGTEVILVFNARTGDNGPTSVWAVIDNGVGILDSEVDRLFQPFERGSVDPRSHADGSGLGLYIAKSSIETLGGNIKHFHPETGGTGYLIELPEPLADEADRRSMSQAEEADRSTYPEMYIILAEDNKLVAEVTQAKLARFIGRVDVVSNGRDAMMKILQDEPDLLITDLFMPEMDGDELARALRERGLTLPIIGLTAAVVGDDIDRFKAAGADIVMTKPMEMRHLRRMLIDIKQKRGAAEVSRLA